MKWKCLKFGKEGYQKVRLDRDKKKERKKERQRLTERKKEIDRKKESDWQKERKYEKEQSKQTVVTLQPDPETVER